MESDLPTRRTIEATYVEIAEGAQHILVEARFDYTGGFVGCGDRSDRLAPLKHGRVVLAPS